MSQINPYINVVVQGMQAQRQMSTDKERHIRRAQTVQKDIAAHDDVLEHQVESTEEPDEDGGQGAEKDSRRDSKKKPKSANGDSAPHLDLTA